MHCVLSCLFECFVAFSTLLFNTSYIFLHVIRYSRKLLREKTFANFTVLWLVFFVTNVNVWRPRFELQLNLCRSHMFSLVAKPSLLRVWPVGLSHMFSLVAKPSPLRVWAVGLDKWDLLNECQLMIFVKRVPVDDKFQWCSLLDMILTSLLLVLVFLLFLLFL